MAESDPPRPPRGERWDRERAAGAGDWGPQADWGTFGNRPPQNAPWRWDQVEGWPSAGAPGRRGPHRGKGPKGWQRSDERIREDVNDRLTASPEVDATEIEVSVSNGEVTLNGTVTGRLAKRLAEDLAETAPGVSDVHNRLHLSASERRAG